MCGMATIPETSTTLLRDLAQETPHARWDEFVRRYRPMMEAFMQERFPSVEADDWDALWTHGGLPEPFVRRDGRFTRRWRKLRREQLFREDLRDLTKIADITGIRVLSELLLARAGTQIVSASLSREIGVAEKTISAVRQTAPTISSRRIAICRSTPPASSRGCRRRATRSVPGSRSWI